MSDLPRPTVALPPVSSFVRALLAPLAGYAAALAAGGLMTGSVFLALAIDGDLDSESGVDSTVLESVLALLALPVQFAGMGLFGTVHFEEDGFDAGLLALPLLVTTAFTVATYIVAKRVERSDPSPGATERLILSFAAGLCMAIVVTVATRLLALRDDDFDIHAASFGLFLGTLLLSTLTAFVARTLAINPSWPRWLAGDWRAAIRLWVHHVLAWVVVAVLILVVWVAIEGSAAGAVLVAIWGPTAALFGYSAAHFGGISVFDENSMGWQIDGPLFAALLVAALLLAVAASVAWSLRRSHDPAWLALPNSWLAVPMMFGVGGFVIWLLPTIRLSGGIEDFGGALTVQPAPWFFLVLTGWGIIIEVGSRTMAPALAERLPARARDLLAGPVVTASVDAPPVTAPGERRPLTPDEARRLKIAGIGLGGVVAILGLGWLTVTIVNSQMYGPESAAEDYLAAIEESDLARAVELAPLDDSEYMDEADEALLESDVYAAAEERIDGYEITSVETEGDTATVTVELSGLSDADEVELTLEKDGRTGLFFDEWKVIDGGLTNRLTIDVPEGSEALAVNGVKVSLESSSDAEYWVFPGSYSFDPFLDNPWVDAVEAEPTVVTPESESWDYADLPDGSASPEFIETVDAELESWITGCMEETELEPEGCPQSAYAYGDDPRNIEWTLVTMPTIDYTYFDGTFPADLSVGDGEARVSFEADESYGFGKPDYRSQTDTSSMYVDATVTEVGGELVVEFDWY